MEKSIILKTNLHLFAFYLFNRTSEHYKLIFLPFFYFLKWVSHSREKIFFTKNLFQFSRFREEMTKKMK